MFLPPRLMLHVVSALAAFLASAKAAPFVAGDTVRLMRGERLMFQGKNHASGAKGQEFTVLRHQAGDGAVYVAWYEEDGTARAVTVAAEALEVRPPEPWSDLLRGVGAFREGRNDEARRLLQRAARDPQHGALASALAARIGGAANAATASGTAAGRQALVTTAQALRDAAAQLVKLGHVSLALWLDEGTDRLTAALPGAPATKLDRTALAPRVAAAQRALHRGRQAAAVHRLAETSALVKEGLQAEPGRPDLVALEKQIARELAYAEESYEAANRMRRFDNGAIHALTAIERGLKACADHPKLRELRKEMQSAFEERTSPPVTAAFLASVQGGSREAALTDGHQLYTTRCTECHDLELLDSRGMDGWQRTVAGMARRAGLSAAEQQRILDYLAAAQRYVESL
jgi:hypothetical protein